MNGGGGIPEYPCPVSEATLSDGARIADYQLSSQATVRIWYVQRGGQTGQQTTQWLQPECGAVA